VLTSSVQFTLRIEGMTCDACARHVTRALQGVYGVEEVRLAHWKSGQAAVLASAEKEGLIWRQRKNPR
jgi:mercuric reductase